MRMRKLGILEVSELGFGILSFASTYGTRRRLRLTCARGWKVSPDRG